MIPALIISGYLGSGKTTLVQRLLDDARANGVRLAIISNEFGDTGIDRALLDAGEDGFAELDGGCVCCKLSDALGETVARVIERASPDRLILETSGVALPGEVRIQFWREPISELISDELVVVLVDGERLLRGDVDETFEQQVEAADLLILNKCDLLSKGDVDVAVERLRAMSGDQPVIRAIRAEVDPALLFPGERVRARGTTEPTPHDHERFGTFELAFDVDVEEADVIARIQAEDAIRAKGFVRTKAGLRVVQGVGQRVELTEPRVPVADGLVGRVVVIRREPGRDAH